jgi:chemotaxis signal transduction protein/chemotaxis methyl-accepting protein methylase
MSTLMNERRIEAEQQERVENIDFKMVTFSLAGKDYGIDIMKVKEIAKDSDFTFVPNTASYVKGVYNLRGDIISIIDLRVMFNLPVEERAAGELENLIILRLEEHIIGIIVDFTDKVVGINSETIQPPHPLFGDINVKYISGVVENDGRLYIILDVDRIFGKDEEAPPATAEGGAAEEAVPELVPEAMELAAGPSEGGPLDLSFISETLATFKKFHVSSINSDWVKSRYGDWQKMRKKAGKEVQLSSEEDAEDFLGPFFSPYTGTLLGQDYLEALYKLLPDVQAGTVSAWNPGCGKGYESFSLAGLLKTRYPNKSIKIWANDSDLLSISSAPGIVFSDEEVPKMLKSFLTEGKNGFQFSGEIKDAILFEYHNVIHENPFPPVDLIFTRDLLSFLAVKDQERILDEFEEKLKPEGIVVLGRNEVLPAEGWNELSEAGVVAYKKE